MITTTYSPSFIWMETERSDARRGDALRVRSFFRASGSGAGFFARMVRSARPARMRTSTSSDWSAFSNAGIAFSPIAASALVASSRTW